MRDDIDAGTALLIKVLKNVDFELTAYLGDKRLEVDEGIDYARERCAQIRSTRKNVRTILKALKAVNYAR